MFQTIFILTVLLFSFMLKPWKLEKTKPKKKPKKKFVKKLFCLVFLCLLLYSPRLINSARNVRKKKSVAVSYLYPVSSFQTCYIILFRMCIKNIDKFHCTVNWLLFFFAECAHIPMCNPRVTVIVYSISYSTTACSIAQGTLVFLDKTRERILAGNRTSWWFLNDVLVFYPSYI